PETQAILPRLRSDLLEAILAVVNSKLSKFKRLSSWSWDSRRCICVVCASGGYPGEYEKGKEIFGLDKVKNMKDIVIFHAGTKKSNGKYLTCGGRVLGVAGLGETLKEAIDYTYQAVGKIHFEGMHYRRDIGKKALINE
ncbi:MAG: phosphoribosylamine--glycine ligase, partial [Candidatus Omnitrophica bacterium]|nr:phosphoribosylamine--glycine ligase [Candidatus Omnitrophota bacterium]